MREKPIKQPAEKPAIAYYRVCRTAVSMFRFLCFPAKYHGLENVPEQAPYIVISNHRSWVDPIYIASKLKKHPIRFLGKKELGGNKFTKWLSDKCRVILVDRNNSDMAAMRSCVNALKEGDVLGIFPEGTRHKEDTMQELHSGASFIAMRSKATILPIYIEKPAKFFQKNQVYIGKPLDTKALYAMPANNDTVTELTKLMQKEVLALPTSQGEKG